MIERVEEGGGGEDRVGEGAAESESNLRARRSSIAVIGVMAEVIAVARSAAVMYCELEGGGWEVG